MPLSVGILVGLFVLQRFGTGTIGRVFGPVSCVWFVDRRARPQRGRRGPAVLAGPVSDRGVRFLSSHGVAGYLVLGGVVLAVTGAEALYADRGHFGAAPIRLGWFGLALPALMLTTSGQAASDPAPPQTPRIRSSRWRPAGREPMLSSHGRNGDRIAGGDLGVVLGRAAGRPARVPAAAAVRHTSTTEGQIYVPVVNWALCVGVVVAHARLPLGTSSATSTAWR